MFGDGYLVTCTSVGLVILRNSFSLHNSDGVTNLGILRESLVFSDTLITVYYVTGTTEAMQCY